MSMEQNLRCVQCLKRKLEERGEIVSDNTYNGILLNTIISGGMESGSLLDVRIRVLFKEIGVTMYAICLYFRQQAPRRLSGKILVA